MALPITPDRVQAAAARLADGGWRFTGRQLYYAVCRDVEVPRARVAPAELSLGALLVLVGAITGNRVAFAVLAALGVLLLAVGAVTHRAERRPGPDSRVLPVSYEAFCTGFLADGGYEGMVVDDHQATPPPTVAAMVVCDRTETAAMLRANIAQLGADVLVSDETAAGLTPVARVVVVHDAGPAGCATAADVRDRFSGAVDAGLNPRDVIGHRPQLIEGAPARLPRDLSDHLDRAEIDWLLDGRRVELATLTPEETALRVRAALTQGPS